MPSSTGPGRSSGRARNRPAALPTTSGTSEYWSQILPRRFWGHIAPGDPLRPSRGRDLAFPAAARSREPGWRPVHWTWGPERNRGDPSLRRSMPARRARLEHPPGRGDRSHDG